MKWFTTRVAYTTPEEKALFFPQTLPRSRKGQWGLISLRGTTWLSCGLRISFTRLPLPPGSFPGGSVVKSLPAKQETRIRSLEKEDPLEKEMATHSSTLAWEITVHGVEKSQTSLSN